MMLWKEFLDLCEDLRDNIEGFHIDGKLIELFDFSARF